MTIAERIALQLKNSIMKGRIKPGDELPSERELAEEYEVNRSSIREAVKRLQGWGLVQVRHGGATRVRDFLMQGLEALPGLIDVDPSKIEPNVLTDVHEIRGMLYGWCAERAAERADEEAVGKLEALVVQMEDPKAKPAQLQVLDYDFFDALVVISGNRVLRMFSKLVRDVYLRAPKRFQPFYEPQVFDPSLHRKALQAIRVKNPPAAADAMRAHAASALNAWRAESAK